MSMSQIRKARNVPAKRGGRIYYTHEGRHGTILSAKAGYLRIRLDGDKHPGSFHPTWKMQYTDNSGRVICDHG